MELDVNRMNLKAEVPELMDPRLLTETVTHGAAALAVTELGLGSLVHGLKIPLGGHLLSLNQGAFLSRATWKLRAENAAYKAPFYISQISALLKSLSPVGDKLGPMLSIGMQGLLFSLPIGLIGPNLAGIALGMFGLSVWGFVQPFVTYYLFFGNDLLRAVEFFLEKMRSQLGASPESVLRVLLIALALKAVLAVAIGLAATRVSDARWIRYQERLRGASARGLARHAADSQPLVPQPTSAGWRARLALRDMLKPFFILSALLMAVFFYYSEGTGARMAWLCLRPLAIAFLFFYFTRSPLLGRLATRLRANPRHTEFMMLFDRTRERLSRVSGGT